MEKQYIYPQNMRTQPKLWFWSLKDIIILGVALTLSVVSWASVGWAFPTVITVVFAFITMRLDDSSVLDYLRRAWRYFVSTQQYYEWRKKEHG